MDKWFQILTLLGIAWLIVAKIVDWWPLMKRKKTDTAE